MASEMSVICPGFPPQWHFARDLHVHGKTAILPIERRGHQNQSTQQKYISYQVTIHPKQTKATLLLVQSTNLHWFLMMFSLFVSYALEVNHHLKKWWFLLEDDKSLLKIMVVRFFHPMKNVGFQDFQGMEVQLSLPPKMVRPSSLIFPFFSRGRQPPMPPSLQPGGYTGGLTFCVAEKFVQNPSECMNNPGKQWGIHEPR